MIKPSTKSSSERFFIGIDYHKRYSVYCVLDAARVVKERGRIDHSGPSAFADLVRRWPGQIVFEASMNWHWLYEVLEGAIASEDIQLANPFKTRIIAEAQVKTDKIDAEILARLLQGGLIARVLPKELRAERRRLLRWLRLRFRKGMEFCLLADTKRK